MSRKIKLVNAKVFKVPKNCIIVVDGLNEKDFEKFRLILMERFSGRNILLMNRNIKVYDFFNCVKKFKKK